MSIEVKTPTREQFEHSEVTCVDMQPPKQQPVSPIMTSSLTVTPPQGTGSPDPVDRRRFISVQCRSHTRFLNQKVCLKFSATGQKKRRYSQFAKHPDALQYLSKRKRLKSSPAEQIVLPTKFLLGGNINDPLNLNSLCDEEIDKLMNAKTPQSSPLPTPSHRQKVDVVIPSNITDPLNLNADDDNEIIVSKLSNRKKKRHHKHKRKDDTSYLTISQDREKRTDLIEDLKIDKNVADGKKNYFESPEGCSKRNLIVEDKIVSPVIPQTSPKMCRGGTLIDGKDTVLDSCAILCSSESPPRKTDTHKISPTKHKQWHISSRSGKHPRFIHGNYNRYYGYRNPKSDDDHRLFCLKKEYFEGKDVLDIGCNVGHMTLTVAQNFNPRKIIGIDIDHSLISAARKNIRYYVTKKNDSTNFPVSNTVSYGPIAAPPLADKVVSNFPQNILFMQGNYVIEHDELLAVEKEEYDTVLALSLTKWIHLNNGDNGLKRTFKRIFKQLRPGGKLILEPQPWSSYKKKKNLTEKIRSNFGNIKLRPEHFTDYLLSKEVGFSTCEVIDVPFNKSKGFRRPVQLFTKPETASHTTVIDGVIAQKTANSINRGSIEPYGNDLKQKITEVSNGNEQTVTLNTMEMTEVESSSCPTSSNDRAALTDISDAKVSVNSTVS